MQAWLDGLSDWPWTLAMAVSVGSVLGAWIVEVVLIGFLRRVVGRTRTELDDLVLDLLRTPIYVSLLLIGLDYAVQVAPLGPRAHGIARAVSYTVAIGVWSVALLRLSNTALRQVAQRAKPGSIVQTRTLPLFDLIAKSAVLASAIYLVMVAWEIDVGAWLASAGVVGIAVGFAARDSLANYFAGVFIIADAPYKLHDVILLDDGTRGRVTEIGLRSTRLHTKDEIEINVPNSVLGNMKIENRSAGPMRAERLSVSVGVAYGSDIDAVLALLGECATEVDGIEEEPPPVVRFVGFGDSSLDLEVHVWSIPTEAEIIAHELHCRIYKALNAADIEIPFPQTDLHVRAMPDEAG